MDTRATSPQRIGRARQVTWRRTTDATGLPQSLVVDGGVAGGKPATAAGGIVLRWKAQVVRAKPQPHLTSRAQLGEAIEYSTNRSNDRGIGMKAYLCLLFAVYESY